MPGAEPPRLLADQSGHGHHVTIGEALRASAVPRTLIAVKPGIYQEAVVLHREVDIVRQGDRALIVVEASDTDALTVTANRAWVRNLTLRAVGTRVRQQRSGCSRVVW